MACRVLRKLHWFPHGASLAHDLDPQAFGALGLQGLMLRGEAELGDPFAKQLVLGLGLLFLGKQGAVEATVEVCLTAFQHCCLCGISALTVCILPNPGSLSVFAAPVIGGCQVADSALGALGLKMMLAIFAGQQHVKKHFW